ncbi:MAG: hypothetical protein QGE95_16310, partial [Arenicellales bacterium]|nr:hypothetical protein [Arenicellales bacterium]
MNKLTVINNSNGASDDNSGTIYLNAGSDVSIVNCLITDNEFRPVFAFSANDANTVSVSYSVLDGGQDSIVTNDNLTINWGNGNFQTQQLGFIDSTNDNFNINATSHLINAGHPDSTDSDGTRADIGAYPYLNSYSGPTWYVQTDGSDTDGTGASATPFASIQSAINFATTDGDSVTVAVGAYVENIDTRDREIDIVGQGQDETIIDGSNSGRVFYVDSDILLDGFTISG